MGRQEAAKSEIRCLPCRSSSVCFTQQQFCVKRKSCEFFRYHPPPQQPRPMMPMHRSQEVMDDKHALYKLQQVQLAMDEVREVERLAIFVEVHFQRGQK